jgi:hypothetical protein
MNPYGRSGFDDPVIKKVVAETGAFYKIAVLVLVGPVTAISY